MTRGGVCARFGEGVRVSVLCWDAEVLNRVQDKLSMNADRSVHSVGGTVRFKRSRRWFRMRGD